MAKKLTSKKAREILHDKSVHGHPLTDKQRKFFGAIAGGAPVKAQDGDMFNPFSRYLKDDSYGGYKTKAIETLSNLPIYSPDIRYQEYGQNIRDWKDNILHTPVMVNSNAPVPGSSYFGYGAPMSDKTWPYQGTVQLDPKEFNNLDRESDVVHHELLHAGFGGNNFIPNWYYDLIKNTARNPEGLERGQHQDKLNERASMALGVRKNIIDQYNLPKDAKVPENVYNDYLRGYLETGLRTGNMSQPNELKESLFGAKSASDLRSLINMENPKKKKNGGWLDSYQDGGSKESTQGGYTDIPFNYNSAWGGQFQDGGKKKPWNDLFSLPMPRQGFTFLQPTSSKLPQGYMNSVTTVQSSERAGSVGGENGEPAFLIPEFKYGHPLENPGAEFRRTGEHLGGPFKTWQEADSWDREIRHPYVEKGQDIPTPLRTWGKDFENGGSVGGTLPGSVGFTYARTGSIPSNGKYAKKTKASAQNGMTYYQHGLDWKPKTISKDGSVIKDNRGQWAHPGEITEIGSNRITMQGVPYPVLGISDQGDTQMMFPGEEYKFKGKKVTEFPMAQKGKKINTTSYNTALPPIYTDDRKKVKAYKDSLYDYESGERWVDLINTYERPHDGINAINESDLNKVRSILIKEFPQIYSYHNQENKPISKYPYYVNTDNNQIVGPVITHLYKKPVQPYKLKPKPPKKELGVVDLDIKPKYTTSTTIKGDITPKKTNIPELKSKGSFGKYKVDYFDPTEEGGVQGGWHTASFETQSDADKYMKTRNSSGKSYGQSMTRRVENKNGGSITKKVIGKSKGSWLDQYK